MVGILENWNLIKGSLLPMFLLVVATTVTTFGISGRVTQWLMKKKGGNRDA